MIYKKQNLRTETKENLRGGNGSVQFEYLLDAPELYDKGRLFSTITLKPGCSIGYHEHTNEMEAYYILSGTGEYNDNGTTTILEAGDVTYTPHGESHSLLNTGETDLLLIALIIYQ